MFTAVSYAVFALVIFVWFALSTLSYASKADLYAFALATSFFAVVKSVLILPFSLRGAFLSSFVNSPTLFDASPRLMSLYCSTLPKFVLSFPVFLSSAGSLYAAGSLTALSEDLKPTEPPGANDNSDVMPPLAMPVYEPTAASVDG